MANPEQHLKMNCLALDDEPMALDILRDYIQATPFLHLQAYFDDALKALSYLHLNKVDLLFIDINMPDLNGLQLIRSLKQQPLIIFTTAYSEYAIEGFELEAIDYLLKPFEFDRFIKACSKAMRAYQLQMPPKLPEHPESLNEDKFLLVKSGAKTHQIRMEDIQWLEASGNYTIFYLKKKKIMSLLHFGEIASKLPQDIFFRVHRSFIVSKFHVDILEPHQLWIGKKKIPISRSRRKAFFERYQP